jgi:hypothetical protein
VRVIWDFRFRYCADPTEPPTSLVHGWTSSKLLREMPACLSCRPVENHLRQAGGTGNEELSDGPQFSISLIVLSSRSPPALHHGISLFRGAAHPQNYLNIISFFVSTKLPAVMRYRYTPLASPLASNCAECSPAALFSSRSVATVRPRRSYTTIVT